MGTGSATPAELPPPHRSAMHAGERKLRPPGGASATAAECPPGPPTTVRTSATSGRCTTYILGFYSSMMTEVVLHDRVKTGHCLMFFFSRETATA